MMLTNSHIIDFAIFVVLQSLAINGIYELFRGACVNDIDKGKVCGGNLFYMIAPNFFEKNKNKEWSKPLYTCIKCMASFWGAVTFFPVAIYLFGFHWEQIFIWMFDAFILVALNYFIYKQL